MTLEREMNQLGPNRWTVGDLEGHMFPIPQVEALAGRHDLVPNATEMPQNDAVVSVATRTGAANG
ncbi:hypothetical protein [Rhodobium gokarnense]|uniref:Uncharacterized protein n=1 Tax=Rhodobium gokarnense TaxID=364296 RepID=A0ABT3HE77_9HYPH|nr:hypothetical protein [Rhodobium gokarnense]MCW2308639.1 hypothetical protein [Rhodobium gokarnense]